MMAADIRVEKVGRCVVLRMERGENRMNPKFIEDMNRALDKAERYIKKFNNIVVNHMLLNDQHA